MPDYRVTWEIEQWAADPHEAATKAWQSRSAPGSQANTFVVTNPATGVAREIDLAVDDPEPSGGSRSQTFVATFEIAIEVEAPSPEQARRLLSHVDFDVRPVGGPVRLGMVRALTSYPVRVSLRSSRDAAPASQQADRAQDGSPEWAEAAAA